MIDTLGREGQTGFGEKFKSFPIASPSGFSHRNLNNRSDQ
jgi:hypothetical protein